MVLWPSTQQILTFLHIFDYFGLKLTSIIYDVIMTPMVFDMICNISFGILIKFPIRLDIICWVKSYFFAIKMTLKAIFTQKNHLKWQVSTWWRHIRTFSSIFLNDWRYRKTKEICRIWNWKSFNLSGHSIGLSQDLACFFVSHHVDVGRTLFRGVNGI